MVALKNWSDGVLVFFGPITPPLQYSNLVAVLLDTGSALSYSFESIRAERIPS